MWWVISNVWEVGLLETRCTKEVQKDIKEYKIWEGKEDKWCPVRG